MGLTGLFRIIKKSYRASTIRLFELETLISCYFSAVTFLITASVKTVSRIPAGREIRILLENPAMIKHTKESAATVMAYGSWVDT